jgi:hypothetical protein
MYSSYPFIYAMEHIFAVAPFTLTSKKNTTYSSVVKLVIELIVHSLNLVNIEL